MLHDKVERNIGSIPNTMFGSLDPKTEFGYVFDLNKAREELKKVKVDIKKYFPIEIVTLVGQPIPIMAGEFFQACLKRIGIESTLVPRTWPTVNELAKKKETTPTIWFSWRSCYYPDPHSWIGEQFSTEKWGNWPAACWYGNPKVDELLHKSVRVIENKERERLYKEASRLVVEDAAAIFVSNEMWVGTFHKDLQGFRFCPVGDANEFRWYHWA